MGSLVQIRYCGAWTWLETKVETGSLRELWVPFWGHRIHTARMAEEKDENGWIPSRFKHWLKYVLFDKWVEEMKTNWSHWNLNLNPQFTTKVTFCHWRKTLVCFDIITQSPHFSYPRHHQILLTVSYFITIIYISHPLYVIWVVRAVCRLGHQTERKRWVMTPMLLWYASHT